MTGYRDTSQKGWPAGRCLVLIAIGTGMVLYGFTKAPIPHALWLVPVGAVINIYVMGKLVAR